MEAVLEQAGIDRPGLRTGRVSRVKNVFRRMFGCWHQRMSLPFTRGGETYRTCVDCGARRRYDLERWRMIGPFYREGDECKDSRVINRERYGSGEEKHNETINCSRYDKNFGYHS